MRFEGPDENAIWDRIGPGLNDALAALGAKDREAGLLADRTTQAAPAQQAFHTMICIPRALCSHGTRSEKGLSKRLLTRPW